MKEIISYSNNANCPENSASSDGTDNLDSAYNSDSTNTDVQACPENLITEDIFHYERIIRYQFKLCHPNCNECKELGISDDDQRCTSYFPQYQLVDGQCIKADLITSSSTQVDSTNDLSIKDDSSKDSSIQDNLIPDSQNQCNYDCVETGICNFNNFDNENGDFYEKIKSC